MAITEATLGEVDALRARISSTVDATTRQLVVAWADAWDELSGLWREAVLELTQAAVDGSWPSRRAVLKAERAAAALEASRASLEQLARQAGITITGNLPKIVNDSLTGQARIYGSQLPPGELLDFAVLEQRTVEAIVKRSTQQVTSLSRPVAPATTQAIKQTLIRGIAVGDNPRAAARKMVERVNGAFEGGLNRAMVIARTEMLDASRTAGFELDKANTDVLAGWEWACALDDRTCPACWSMHGRRFPLSQPGPEDHQQGRCARLPATLSWRELGFNIPEPGSILPDAQRTFNALPQDTRVAIMGKARLDLLDSGRVQWGDLAGKRSTTGWRDSWAPVPVADLAK